MHWHIFFFHDIVLTKGQTDLSLWLLFFFINIKGNNSILFKFLGQSFSFICYFSWQNINSWAAHVQLMFDLWHNATLIVPNLFSSKSKISIEKQKIPDAYHIIHLKNVLMIDGKCFQCLNDMILSNLSYCLLFELKYNSSNI